MASQICVKAPGGPRPRHVLQGLRFHASLAYSPGLFPHVGKTDLIAARFHRPYAFTQDYMHVSWIRQFLSHHRPPQSAKSPGSAADSLLSRSFATGNPWRGYFSTADPDAFPLPSTMARLVSNPSVVSWRRLGLACRTQWRVPARGSSINVSILICDGRSENSAARASTIIEAPSKESAGSSPKRYFLAKLGYKVSFGR